MAGAVGRIEKTKIKSLYQQDTGFSICIRYGKSNLLILSSGRNFIADTSSLQSEVRVQDRR